MIRRFVIAAWAAALALGAGCESSTSAPTCRDIPAGGCPIAYGDPCSDLTCTAAFQCVASGQWQLDHECPAHPDAAIDAPADSPNDVSDTGAARDVQFDVPGAGGGPGCEDLEMPDCPLAVAEACGVDCCGCEDLYVCQNGGWNEWGQCGDGGIVPH